MAPVLLFVASPIGVGRKSTFWAKLELFLQEAPGSLLRPSGRMGELPEGLSLAHSPGPSGLPLLDRGPDS
jgi:hypothetical protein